MEINEVYFLLFLVVYTYFIVAIGSSDCPQIKFRPDHKDNQLVHIFRDSKPYEVECLVEGVPPTGSIKWYHVQGVYLHEYQHNTTPVKEKNGIQRSRISMKPTTTLNNTSLYCVYQYSDGELQIVSPEIKLYSKYISNKIPTYPKNDNKIKITTGYDKETLFVDCTTKREQVIELYQVTDNVTKFLGGTEKTELANSYSYNKKLTNCDKNTKIYCTALDNMEEESFIISEKVDVIYNESNENSEVCELIPVCKSTTTTTSSDKNHEFNIVVVISAAVACLIVIILIIFFCVRKKQTPIIAQASSKPEVLYAEIEILQKCNIQLPPPREEAAYAQIIGVLKPSSNNNNTWNRKMYTDVLLSKIACCLTHSEMLHRLKLKTFNIFSRRNIPINTINFFNGTNFFR